MINRSEASVEYYNRHAEEYIQKSVDADMSDLRLKFQSMLPDKGWILDCGCGSGRDTLAFKQAGFIVLPVDGSVEMCKATERLTGISARCMMFDEIDFEDQFDGIWACASLLHVEKAEIPVLLKKLNKATKDNGVLYMSFKYGDFDDNRNERHYTDLTEEDVGLLCSEETGWDLIRTVNTGDTLGRQTTWINIFARKHKATR